MISEPRDTHFTCWVIHMIFEDGRKKKFILSSVSFDLSRIFISLDQLIQQQQQQLTFCMLCLCVSSPSSRDMLTLLVTFRLFIYNTSHTPRAFSASGTFSFMCMLFFSLLSHFTALSLALSLFLSPFMYPRSRFMFVLRDLLLESILYLSYNNHTGSLVFEGRERDRQRSSSSSLKKCVFVCVYSIICSCYSWNLFIFLFSFLLAIHVASDVSTWIYSRHSNWPHEWLIEYICDHKFYQFNLTRVIYAIVSVHLLVFWWSKIHLSHCIHWTWMFLAFFSRIYLHISSYFTVSSTFWSLVCLVC